MGTLVLYLNRSSIDMVLDAPVDGSIGVVLSTPVGSSLCDSIATFLGLSIPLKNGLDLWL